MAPRRLVTVTTLALQPAPECQTEEPRASALANPEATTTGARRYGERDRRTSASMPALRILNAQGDTCVTWDEARYAAGDAEQVAAVMEAERLFAEARSAGGTAFRVRPGVP